MATSPNRWIVSLVALAVALAACGPCVTPRMAPGPTVDETRPVATYDPAADDPWLHTRGTPTPAAVEAGAVHDR
jgi:hypothetical protein